MDFVLIFGSAIIVVLLSVVIILWQKLKLALPKALKPHTLAVSNTGERTLSNDNQSLEITESYVSQIDLIVSRLSKMTSDHKSFAGSLFSKQIRVELANLRSISHNLLRKNSPANDSHHAESHFIQTKIKPTLFSVFQAVRPIANKYSSKLVVRHIDDATIKLSTVFFNNLIRELLVNSFIHNRFSTCVSISAHQVENQLKISIRDDGKGIPASKIDQVFQQAAIRQAHYRRYSDSECFIDLPSIISSLRASGGDIEIRSAIEFGTCVWLTIPLSAQNCEPLNVENSELDDYENYDVLVFQGSEADSHKKQQRINGRYRSLKISYLNEAIASIYRKQPKLIVCDVADKFSEALQLKQTIEHDKALSNIPLVLVTNALLPEERLQIMQAGISFVLEEPFVPQELVQLIHNILHENKRSAQRVEEAIVDYALEKQARSQEFHKDFEAKFKSCLEENFADAEFSKKQCADLLTMHEKTLQRHIHKLYDTSFREYLRRYRLMQAKELIISGMPVTSASLAVGIYSPSYFSKCFRTEFGFMPSTLSKKVG